LRNTGFIIAGTIICLYVEHRQSLDKQNICQGQVIEEFIDKVGQASPLVIIMSGEDA